MPTSNPPPEQQREHNSEDERRIQQLEQEVSRLKSDLRELEVLNDLAIAASSTQDIDHLLDIVVEKSVKALRAKQGAIKLLTEQAETPFKTLTQVDERSRLTEFRVGIHIIGWVLHHREPLLIEDLAGDTRFHATPQEKEEIHSLLCVPIISHAEMLGIIMVTNKRGPEPFNQRDKRLLTIIAAQSGHLIRNRQLQAEALEKKRIEQELALARGIQMRLIPKEVPPVKNLQIASYIQTADQVGGDYFDFFMLGDNRLGIVVADVSGHGFPAALIMTMVKGILHSVTQKFQSPDRVLAELNSVLYNITPPEIFVTMMFLVFDSQNMVLRYSNAGHAPVFYGNAAKGSCERLIFYSPSLCISPASQYQEREIPLKPGDIFFIYTDGVTESFNSAGKMLSEEGLFQEIKSLMGETPGKIINRITDTLINFRGAALQHDDIAMIAVGVE